jgi:hypothetical protein
LQIALFILLPFLLFAESYESEFYYDSVLSCDEVRKKIGEVKVEISKKEKSKGYFLDHWTGMIPFASADEYDVKILEKRVKNLEALEREKCDKKFRKQGKYI